MERDDSDIEAARFLEGPEMIAAMRRGVVEALLDHRKEGRSVITWDRDNRRVVEIPSDQIVIPEIDNKPETHTV